MATKVLAMPGGNDDEAHQIDANGEGFVACGEDFDVEQEDRKLGERN